MSPRSFLIILFAAGFAFAANAQQKTDTVKVPLARTSQIIFTMKDRSDLETLKHYNFQELFNDILIRLEKPDSATAKITPVIDTVAHTTTETVVETTSTERWENNKDDDERNDDDDNDDNWEWGGRHKHWGRTRSSFNFDLGSNNYLSNGSFPDKDNQPYAVRPWGSWYIALNSIQRSRISRNFFLEWGGGISWYTFKFQNANTVANRTDTGMEFISDTNPDRSYRKSKMGITFINASLIPVLDFGGSNRKARFWNGDNSSFRIGLGPYVGYRISSLTKVIYEEDGHREKEKDRGNLYLNNLRYGARLQLGFHSTDLFFNYDMNELFASGRGPNLNAFSFGVIF